MREARPRRTLTKRLRLLAAALAAGVAAGVICLLPPPSLATFVMAALVIGCACALCVALFAPSAETRAAEQPRPIGRGLAALTAGVREVTAGDLTKNLAADGELSEVVIALNRLIFALREALGALRAHSASLGAGGQRTAWGRREFAGRSPALDRRSPPARRRCGRTRAIDRERGRAAYRACRSDRRGCAGCEVAARDARADGSRGGRDVDVDLWSRRSGLGTGDRIRADF